MVGSVAVSVPAEIGPGILLSWNDTPPVWRSVCQFLGAAFGLPPIELSDSLIGAAAAAQVRTDGLHW